MRIPKRRRCWRYGAAAGLLLSAATVVFAAVAATEGLRSNKLQEREACFDKIVQERADLITELVSLARTRVEGKRIGGITEYPHRDAKHLAILLLGEIRAAEAAPHLVEKIEYRNPRESSDIGYRLGLIEGPGWHPAVESLIKIGMPSVGPVIEKLGTYAQDCLGRRLCLVVLKEVLGPRLAKVCLEMAVEEAKDDAARANLKAALEQLEPEPQAAEPPAP